MLKKEVVFAPDHDVTGEEGYLVDGRKMTIIRYNDLFDVDIQIENGPIVTGQHYYHIHQGLKYSNDSDSVGEVSVFKGQKITLIRYGSPTDIDVQFEDGTIIKHVWYIDFTDRVDHLNQGHSMLDDQKWKDEVKMANCGLMMRIIRFEKWDNVDVQFEDGRIVYHRSYYNFKKGSISPSIKRRKRKIITA